MKKWTWQQWAALASLLMVWLADTIDDAAGAALLSPEVEIWALKIVATLGLLSRRIGVLLSSTPSATGAHGRPE